MIPLSQKQPDELYASLPRNNFIDGLVWKKLKSLGVKPSDSIDDAKYMRRVFIDIIGRLPSPAEAREFLGSAATNRREQLVEQLLKRPEYADHWANKWADLLRPNPYRVGIKAVFELRQLDSKSVSSEPAVRRDGSRLGHSARKHLGQRRPPRCFGTVGHRTN